MARADINQQRAAKTVVAAMAVGKRRQAGGGWRRQQRWRWRQGAAAAAMASGERPEVKVEIGVPHTLLGNYLVQSRAMFLANAYLGLSQCLASRHTIEYTA